MTDELAAFLDAPETEERVARAISDTTEIVEWEDVPEDSVGAWCRRDYRIMARAAIDSIRIPHLGKVK